MSNSSNCPKCSSPLPPRLTTGRLVCSRCGWTNKPKNTLANQDWEGSIDNTPETVSEAWTDKALSVEKKLNTPSSRQVLGWLLFIVGSGMLGIGLMYDPTVSSGELGLERTYNIGAINIKNTYTNSGGFLAVCGAIFTLPVSNKNETENTDS